MNRTDLARRSLRAAIDFRIGNNIPEDAPICIYDLAEVAGLDVRFCEGDSFEGLFSKQTSTVLVPTSRPRGRQAFACAHEVGHWYFGHGSRLELLLERSPTSVDPEEFLANVFAGYLLMSPWAVRRALKRRSLIAKNLSSTDLYTIASQFGVGYQTLADHLCFSLKFISRTHRAALVKTSPKEVREEILGALGTGCSHALIVDDAWETIPIDLQVGDLAVLPSRSNVEGQNVSIVGEARGLKVVKAVRPGLGRCETPGSEWAAFIRVSRAKFVGRSTYRHLEDPDVN